MIRPAPLFALIAGLWTCAVPACADGLDVAMGKALFGRVWVPAPASTDAADGLGPLFNARSCAACHPGGGRGQFAETDQGQITGDGLVLRIGTWDGSPDPVYGRQLQTRAVQGLPPEGRVKRVSTGGVWAQDLTSGRPHDETRMAGRLAPALFGIGSLAQVPDAVLLARADPDDRDGDGISGRANLLADGRIGRFGWKAGLATIRAQSAAALHLDLGLSSPPFPDPYGDCGDRQDQCRVLPNGASARFDGFEVSATMLDLITAYVAALPAPAAVDDPDGAALFDKAGCAACHTPSLGVATGGQVRAYTDLLLHDMGNRLADGIGEGAATGREWRTAPLWGVGTASRFLHDGRATDLEAAILLHDGEAAQTRRNFEALPVVDRAALLDFLKRL